MIVLLGVLILMIFVESDMHGMTNNLAPKLDCFLKEIEKIFFKSKVLHKISSLFYIRIMKFINYYYFLNFIILSLNFFCFL